MKDKSSRTKRVAEVLDEIQSYLDSESARMEMPGGMGAMPVDLRFVSASRNSLPTPVLATQYYLSQHRKLAPELIEFLPSELFIVC
ncbi:MAG TPA: hypothetical protein PLA90_00430 [Candidatus Sumerlaeota bacterium]|nr:hypothetical protein [Candidatus Sumerlaeota bacterium]HPR99987.1 hypothetical protein [Candidatus Sumerlaeota bacterium]